jgi:hypothetical protein
MHYCDYYDYDYDYDDDYYDDCVVLLLLLLLLFLHHPSVWGEWMRYQNQITNFIIINARAQWQERAYHWLMSHEATIPSCLLHS